MKHSREYRAQQGGAAYQISIWTPEGDAPQGGWPVVYVLDAKAMFATFVESIQRSGRRPDATGIGMAAVVGIAHGGERLFATEQRYRDYTFEASPLMASALSADKAGGGADFLHFITEQLMPDLAAEFSFNLKRHTLFGHSLAGYFVLNVLALRPNAFSHYAAISPSIWWNSQTLHARIKNLEQQMLANLGGVLIAVGEWEGQPAPWLLGSDGRDSAGLSTEGLTALMARRDERKMIVQASAMAERLRSLLGEQRLSYRCFPEEDHSSIVMIAIQRSLRLMFS